MLIWFYFSWGMGRAYFPQAANELCQVAKLEEVVSPIKAALPIGSRYYKSTLLVARNADQLDELPARLPVDAFSDQEQAELNDLIGQVRSLMVNSSDPTNLSRESAGKLDQLVFKLNALSTELRAAEMVARGDPNHDLGYGRGDHGKCLSRFPIIALPSRPSSSFCAW